MARAGMESITSSYQFRANDKRCPSGTYMTPELIAIVQGERRAGTTEAAERLQLAAAASIGHRGKRLVSPRT